MGERPPAGTPHPKILQRSHRVAGVMVVGLGVGLTGIGVISLFSSWNTIGGSRYFWAAFLGLPLIAIGSLLTQLTDLGAYRRNRSGEMTRVTDDTASDFDGYERDGPTVNCQRCQAVNPATAKFCNQCGITLAASICPGCGAETALNARFCNQCGKPLE